MNIKPWNIYLTRGGKYGFFDNPNQPRRCVLVLQWHLAAHRLHRGYWAGMVWGDGCYRILFRRWGVFGSSNLDGTVSSEDLTEHLISVRNLMFRKLNPPTALIAQVEARWMLEALYA